ncbi:hypothetical protein ACIBU0_33655 [Streptomyces sp. NPDC049627]|uniref:hypothetical protein n=1 Tax=Streptomyces sp. NPDC049627 TaxID=3365595 RepID=UPI0037A7A9CA
MAGESALVGRWVKMPREETSGAACDRRYPEILEFLPGTYLGTRGAGQGFIVWDAGIWREDGPGAVRIATASDELAQYGYVLSDDVLTFRDADGCEFSYRRAASAVPPAPE